MHLSIIPILVTEVNCSKRKKFLRFFFFKPPLCFVTLSISYLDQLINHLASWSVSQLVSQSSHIPKQNTEVAVNIEENQYRTNDNTTDNNKDNNDNNINNNNNNNNNDGKNIR